MFEVYSPAIVYISLAELVVHLKLTEIYGDNEDCPALEKTISERGVLESLKPSARTVVNVILAGKCCLQIGYQWGISAVKVELVESRSLEEDLKLVLGFNLYCVVERTHYQKFHAGQYFESVLRTQRKGKQHESARSLNESKYSNLNNLIDDNKIQLNRGTRLIHKILDSLGISVGSYYKGKEVFEYIFQIWDMQKLKVVFALEADFTRDISAVYKFVFNQDICEQFIDLTEVEEVGTISDGITWMCNAELDPFCRFQVGQVYKLEKILRPEWEVLGWMIYLTNGIIVFGLRNLIKYETGNFESKSATV
jgi:hypothetical protein